MSEERRSTEVVVDKSGKAVIHAGNLHVVLPFATFALVAALIWQARGWKEDLATKDDLATLQRDVSTALEVLKDHGTEFVAVRAADTALNAKISAMEIEFRAEIREKTQDRYTATQAARELALARREWMLEHEEIHNRRD